MRVRSSKTPDWDRLYTIAASQDGYFTTQQARQAGYSDQLLFKYLHANRIARARRSVYRIVHFPSSEHEDLTVIWLWSERAGVFSHETTLSLHALSDVLPSKAYITLPLSWQTRRLRVPEGVEIHYADVPENERGWFGSIPVTSPARTLEDCAKSSLSREIILKAIQDAVSRGLIDKKQGKKLRSVIPA
jgi:predicted transcriptional regulator of viral defense system